MNMKLLDTALLVNSLVMVSKHLLLRNVLLTYTTCAITCAMDNQWKIQWNIHH
jgi:hypothetical protein